MQDLFIEFLPPWVETNLQPAFYDRESGTVLQQTARMYAKINAIIERVNNFHDYGDEIVALRADMQALEADNLKFQHDMQISIDAQMNHFMSEVIYLISSQINALRQHSDDEDAKLKAYIDNAIIGKIYLYNPITGLVDSLQDVISALYDATRDGAITASEYDALELSATTYDNMEITAFDYDNNGKEILTL